LFCGASAAALGLFSYYNFKNSSVSNVTFEGEKVNIHNNEIVALVDRIGAIKVLYPHNIMA